MKKEKDEPTVCEKLKNLVLEMRANKIDSIHIKSKEFKKGSYIDVDNLKHLQIYLTQLDLFLIDGRGKTFLKLVTFNGSSKKILRLPLNERTISKFKKNANLCPTDEELAKIKIKEYVNHQKIIHAMI